MDIDELMERMYKAVDSLERLAELSTEQAKTAPYADVYLHVQNAERLRAKAEGVKLAISYAEESQRQPQ